MPGTPKNSQLQTGWIKICGVRDLATARDVVALKPSAIGLNFFAKSSRVVSIADARAIVESLGDLPRTTPVGLFVNQTLDEVGAIAAQVGLRAAQLHGDETPEFLRQLHERHSEWKLFKAFRVGDSLQPVAEFIAACQRLNVPLAGCFLDAKVEGAFGGTGHVAPWELIARNYDRTHWPPLILAGGLTPDNVAEAIATVRPFGVDTASGVESSPGVKDTKLVAQFVAEAQRAFAAT